MSAGDSIKTSNLKSICKIVSHHFIIMITLWFYIISAWWGEWRINGS